MTLRPDSHPLHRSVAALGDSGHLPHLGRRLTDTATAIEAKTFAQVRQDIDAFDASGNPDVLPELREHLTSLVAGVCDLLGDDAHIDFDFVDRHAERRALQRFPLEALLHAYRSSHRVIAPWIREAASVTAAAGNNDSSAATAGDFALEYTDAVSNRATAAYVRHTRRLAEAEGDRRTELLNLLLSGYDESDSRTSQLLRRSGYLEQRQSFCVVVARSVDAREMDNPARAQRMIDAIASVLRDTPVRSLFNVREGAVVGVVSGARRTSGWTAPQSRLADRILGRLEQVGPAALIGMSNDAPSTTHVRRAYEEARLALDFASVTRRVMRFAEIPFREMIVRLAQNDIHNALPVWLDDLAAADEKAKGKLSATLRAYADTNMNALKAGEALSVHTNTIYSRAQKIARITGKDPLSYHDLTELLLALDCRANLAR